MSEFILPQATFERHRMERDTMIEDMPQVSVRRAAPPRLQRRASIVSPLSDNFPTPKAHDSHLATVDEDASSSIGSDSESDSSSVWSKRSSGSDFDEMYDMTESESEGEVPIKLSQSIKKRQMAVNKHRRPSLVIPSPSQWPTIDKLKSAATPLSPPTRVNIAPDVLARLQSTRVPSSSATPSLDGNYTDDEMTMSTCPSTPDIEHQVNAGGQWEAPMQLDPSSISLLEHISGEDQSEILETVIEVPEEAVEEMRQIVESPPVTARMVLQTQNLAPPKPQELDDELSALSVPSPGGFFASLDSSLARHTWSGTETTPSTSVATDFYDVPFRLSRASNLPTSTATSFYDLPWTQRPDNAVEQTIEIESSLQSEGPVTARKVFSPIETIEEVDEIDETYQEALDESSGANIDRTALWLSSQSDYMKALCEDTELDLVDSFKDVEDAVPRTPELVSPPSATSASPSKKSVRFADDEAKVDEAAVQAVQKRISPIHDGTFWEGWRHNKRSQRARDVFQHRQARAEAEHVKRTSSLKQHLEQLQGKYEILAAERPAPQRPVSSFLPVAVEDEKKEVIQRAECERQALDQMQSASWHLAAQKELTGGQLLTSPIVQSFRGRKDVRILDLAGQVHCNWAWAVALDHPDAAVYTTVSTDAEAHVADSTLDGPANHFVEVASKTWELPFEDNYFDVISARKLYSHLRTIWPKGHAADEWDLTLRECLRCLKPGGYLEYDLLDAELIHPEPAGQALGVEFAFSLKTRGYDPVAGKTFLPRLKRAGFSSIKRAWMVLPVADVLPRWVDAGRNTMLADSCSEKIIGPNGEIEYYEPALTGSTKDVRAMTGLVGARMWEQWMLKLNSEMGRDESRCLEGVAKALEECGKGKAGWRCLVGWARK